MMTPIIVLALIALFFGLGGFFLKVLWYVLVVSIIFWLIGFFIRGPNSRWFYW